MLGYVIRVRVKFRIRLRSGCSDYNPATLQSVVLKLTDALSILERVKRLVIVLFLLHLLVKNNIRDFYGRYLFECLVFNNYFVVIGDLV